MKVWGISPFSLSFLCHTPPWHEDLWNPWPLLTTVGPGTNDLHKASSQAPDLSGESGRNLFEASFPCSPGWILSVFGKDLSEGLHLSRRLLKDRKQFMDFVKMTHNHNEQSLQKQPIRVKCRSTGSLGLWSRHGNEVHQSHQRDKKRTVSYHRGCLPIGFGVVAFTLVWRPRSGKPWPGLSNYDQPSSR
jgi:hypothetical protein